MSPVTSTCFIPINLHTHCDFMLVAILILDIKQWQLWRRNIRSVTDFATWRWNALETFFNLLYFVINIPRIMSYLGDSFRNWWPRCTIFKSYESIENMQRKHNEAVKIPRVFSLFVFTAPSLQLDTTLRRWSVCWGIKKYRREPNGLGIWLPVRTRTPALGQQPPLEPVLIR